MDSPLLSYIDVRHTSFLPPQLTIGEARDLTPWNTTADSLALVRDASVDLVSKSHRVHIPIEEQKAPARITEPAAKSVNSSEAGVDQGGEMVTKKNMTINQFLPDTRPMSQPQ